eukprot:846743-Rhodomonas_salina.5
MRGLTYSELSRVIVNLISPSAWRRNQRRSDTLLVQTVSRWRANVFDLAVSRHRISQYRTSRIAQYSMSA